MLILYLLKNKCLITDSLAIARVCGYRAAKGFKPSGTFARKVNKKQENTLQSAWISTWTHTNLKLK